MSDGDLGGAVAREGRSSPGHGGTLEDMRDSARSIHSRGPAWLNTGWLVVAAALALTLFGVAAIDTTQPGSAIRQFVHLLVGLVFAIVVAVPDYRRLRRFTWPLAIRAQPQVAGSTANAARGTTMTPISINEAS